jgi:hypothetical protein
MRLSSKILVIWLAVMWVVFSVWVFAVTNFPLNFGFVGLQSLTGIALVWTMIQYRDIYTSIEVPSE